MTTAPGTPTAPARRAVAALLVAAALAVTACGGASDMMTRQEFVDSLGEQGDGLINDNIASCMYDGLSDDPEAAEAVQGWQDGESVPPELIDLATECLANPGETPGT